MPIKNLMDDEDMHRKRRLVPGQNRQGPPLSVISQWTVLFSPSDKHQDKLFTFIHHDGVPWNNNNNQGPTVSIGIAVPDDCFPGRWPDRANLANPRPYRASAQWRQNKILEKLFTSCETK